MTDFGIKVSQPGKDVKTATPTELSFTSKNFLLKVFAQGQTSFSLPNDGATHTASVAHNLGYRPAFLVWTDSGGGTNRYMCPLSLSSIVAWGKSDNTNLVLSGKNTSGASVTIVFYYFIFYDKGGV